MKALFLLAVLLPASVANAQTWTYLGLGQYVALSIQSEGPWLYVGTQDGFYRKDRASADTTWTYLSLIGLEVDDFEFLDGQTVVATRRDPQTSGSALIRSTDAGLTWTTVLDPGTDFKDVEIHPAFRDTVYACGNPARLYKSTDRGVNWTLVPTPASIGRFSTVRIAPNDNQHLLVGGESGFFSAWLFESLNGGATWSLTSLGSPGGDNAVYEIDFDPTDFNRLITGMENWIGRSENGGDSWSYYNLTGVGLLYALDVLFDPWYPSRAFAACHAFEYTSPLHLAMSQDQGMTWTVLEHDPGFGEGAGFDLELVSEAAGTSVYLAGSGVHRVTGFATSSVPGPNRELPAISLSTPYLRNDQVVIPYGVGLPATRLQLSIFDVAGRPVRRFAAVMQGPGTYEALWPGRDDGGKAVAPGVYFVRLSTAGTHRVSRFAWLNR